MDYRLDARGSISGRGKQIFSTPQPLDRLWRSNIFLFIGYWGSYTGVKRLGLEADHSLPSGVEVKNGEAVPPLTHVSSRFMT
jgi:hypothetical protein